VKGKIDLSEIKKASEQIGKALKNVTKYHVVVVKSTVVPGTTKSVVKPLLEKYSSKTAGQNFGLCMNPEFLREGNAIDDAFNPDRIVIGQYDEKSGKTLAKIYAGNIKSTIILTNLQTAELMKYASNSLLATMISFSNEISRIAESTKGIDITDVWRGVYLDQRLSPVIEGKKIIPPFLSYIFSGCGYGGSCFPKDTKALAEYARSMGINAELIESVININHSQPDRMIRLLENVIGKLEGKKIAVLGLAFKPNTDDLRESPSIPIIKSLLKKKAVVICHDPQAQGKAGKEDLKALNIIFSKNPEEALEGADGALLVTSWDEYKSISPKTFKEKMKNPVLIDGRRLYEKEKYEKEGIIYRGIGYSG